MTAVLVVAGALLTVAIFGVVHVVTHSSAAWWAAVAFNTALWVGIYVFWSTGGQS